MSRNFRNLLAQGGHRAEEPSEESGRDVSGLQPLRERSASNQRCPVGSARDNFHKELAAVGENQSMTGMAGGEGRGASIKPFPAHASEGGTLRTSAVKMNYSRRSRDPDDHI